MLVVSSCATTPKMLVQSAESGDYAEVKRLIEESINVNARTIHGETALMNASKYGHMKIAKFLIEEGADVNTQTSDRHTALMFASQGETFLHTTCFVQWEDIL